MTSTIDRLTISPNPISLALLGVLTRQDRRDGLRRDECHRSYVPDRLLVWNDEQSPVQRQFDGAGYGSRRRYGDRDGYRSDQREINLCVGERHASLAAHRRSPSALPRAIAPMMMRGTPKRRKRRYFSTGFNPTTVTARIPFWKLQSIGNDFPLVHLADLEALCEEETAAVESLLLHPPDDAFVSPDLFAGDLEHRLATLARSMADRRRGVGGDGLLATKPQGADRVLLRMFNPDGTVDFCGNGLRCAAVHARAQGWVGEAFTIEHLGRDVAVRIGNGRVATELGGATYDPEKVPIRRETELFRAPLPGGRVGSALSTGSTHTVLPVDALPDDATFFAESHLLENLDLFPDRTSVIWTPDRRGGPPAAEDLGAGRRGDPGVRHRQHGGGGGLPSCRRTRGKGTGGQSGRHRPRRLGSATERDEHRRHRRTRLHGRVSPRDVAAGLALVEPV